MKSLPSITDCTAHSPASLYTVKILILHNVDGVDSIMMLTVRQSHIDTLNKGLT